MSVRELKDAAVRERRLWVRLTRNCNNRCLFCLDSDCQDGSFEKREDVVRLIEEGKEEGAERLILSGGEPTIHPDFLWFVEFGKRKGFSWIQVVTNGRMFAYPKFARQAVAAGLNEATFSMHGHTAELHDRLVGVNGAFRQSIAGMRNLLGRIVVNVDVVLNRLNIPVLKELLEFYIGLGITEFDLLHIVPFGRAWNVNRDLLYYDPAEMAPFLRRAFALRKRKGIIMWTNRLPARYLEGCEDLIQDPHKLHDEVRGRAEMFEAWRDRGIRPPCRDDRCVFCAMEGFCSIMEKLLSGGVWHPPELAKCLAGREELIRRGGGVGVSGATAGSGRDLSTETRQSGPSLQSLHDFTEWYISHAYFVKSLRCEQCQENANCSGIHIDVAREVGLRVLQPILAKSAG